LLEDNTDAGAGPMTQAIFEAQAAHGPVTRKIVLTLGAALAFAMFAALA
jgi:hypothetical protein